jgi:hypothetical protein
MRVVGHALSILLFCNAGLCPTADRVAHATGALQQSTTASRTYLAQCQQVCKLMHLLTRFQSPMSACLEDRQDNHPGI